MADKCAMDFATFLALAEQYVVRGALLIFDQRTKLRQCEVNGWDVTETRRRLAEIERTQKLLITQRDRLRTLNGTTSGGK